MKNLSSLKFRQVTLGILIFMALMIFASTCNTCAVKNAAKTTQYELDSLQVEFLKLRIKTLSFDQANLLIQKEGLETELRMLVNTNQIFLTRKRPDERVLEIQKELKAIENKVKALK